MRLSADEIVPGIVRTPEGYLRVWVRIARAGLYEYPEHGFTAEVPASTITDMESLATLRGKPITLGHPPEGVTPANMRSVRHGTVIEVEVRGAEPFAFVQLDTPEAIALCERMGGALTCSPSYDYEAVAASDPAAAFAQERGVYNHLAILRPHETPRGGPRCRTILTATDGVSMLTPEILMPLLEAAGVPEANRAELIKALLAAIPQPEMEDKGNEAAMDAVKGKLAIATRDLELTRRDLAAVKGQLAAAVKRATDAEATATAATKRAADAEKVVQDAKDARIKPLIKKVADSLKIGEGADHVKTAEQIAERLGSPLTGQDALTFVEGYAAHVTTDKGAAFAKPHKIARDAGGKADDAAFDDTSSPWGN